jgi:DNA-binding transcriptional LysR family regulator
MLRDIVNLRIFVAVANCKSFTRAAAVGELTQGAISIRIKRLEKQIGMRLFDRSSQQLQLTAEGEIFLPYVLRILAVYDEAKNDIEHSKL